MGESMRKVTAAVAFVETRGRGTGFLLKRRFRLTLDCGHRVERDEQQSRALCPKGCTAPRPERAAGVRP